MPEEIRGLNIKFDADFSDFKKSIRSADKDIKSTERQLKTLQDSLKIKWDSSKFSKAQQQAQKALEATEKKASLLRQRLQQMDQAGVTEDSQAEYEYLSEQLEKTELNALRLQQRLEELDEIKLKNLTSGIDAAADKLDKAAQKTKALSLAAFGLAAGLTAIGLKTVEQADEIATLATQYDMTTDAIQRFNYVALQTDTSADYLYKGFVKVQAGIADLKTGISSVSTKALEQLNLSFDQFSGAEDQFYAIIDALANMEDQAKMVSLANDIFGERMATNLFPLIYAGTDAVNEYRQEWEKMGALSEEQIFQLAEFDNVLNELKIQFMNTGLQLGQALLPVMKSFSETLVKDILPVIKDVVHWFGNLDEWQQKALISLLLITAALSPALKLMSGLAKGISVLVKWLGSLEMATVKTYGKWMLLIAAIGTLFNVISNWNNMGTVQKVISLLGALSAAALAAALAFGVFHSAWSIGTAIAGIVAGIAAATAAVNSAADSIGADVSFDVAPYEESLKSEHTIPSGSSYGDTITTNESTYVDNSNIVVNIEKNEYMSEEDIIRAVNKGLKQAKQMRT